MASVGNGDAGSDTTRQRGDPRATADPTPRVAQREFTDARDSRRDQPADRQPAPLSREAARRRRQGRALLNAFGHRATYDFRRNVGLWIGLGLGLPVPLLALAYSAPGWVTLVSWVVPIVWSAVLGAAVRVARVGVGTMQRMETDASALGREHHEALHRVAAGARRASRDHDDAMDRMTAEASRVGHAHARESGVLRSTAESERTERERLEALQDLMGTELALAQRVNRSLLPEDLLRPDLEVIVRQIPCSYVGGDYLHVALPRSDLLYLCIGDVAGHGVSAALVVSRIHGLVQRLILEQHPPEKILEDLDRAMIEILAHTPIFMTLAVFRVDLAARRIDYAMGGHPAQLLLRADGSIEHLTAGNGLLGLKNLDALGPMKPGSATLRDGDTLVLFTDGLFEVAAREDDTMLGESGLLTGLDSLAGHAADVVAAEILRRVVAFGHEGPFQDDVSLMVARFGAEVRGKPS